MFDEEAEWSWNKDNEVQSKIPIEAIEEQISNEAPAPISRHSNSIQIDGESNEAHAPTSRYSNSTQTSGGSTNSSNSRFQSSARLELPSDETLPQKVKSLRKIYDSCTVALVVIDPTTYEEASLKQEWREAMQEELTAIKRNQTCDLVDLPEGKKSVGIKWVFKTKYKADGTLQKHKDRLVVKGYSQTHGVDFDETFSLVARFETIQVFIALAAQLQWSMFQLDIKSAFLNGELQEEVYVKQPIGFVINGSESKVYKLKMALYGLREAPRAWHSKIDDHLIQRGFERSSCEPTLYKKKEGDSVLLVCLYVDDVIYMWSRKSMVDEFKQRLMNTFEMSDLGLLQYFLGLEVKQEME